MALAAVACQPPAGQGGSAWRASQPSPCWRHLGNAMCHLRCLPLRRQAPPLPAGCQRHPEAAACVSWRWAAADCWWQGQEWQQAGSPAARSWTAEVRQAPGPQPLQPSWLQQAWQARATSAQTQFGRPRWPELQPLRPCGGPWALQLWTPGGGPWAAGPVLLLLWQGPAMSRHCSPAGLGQPEEPPSPVKVRHQPPWHAGWLALPGDWLQAWPPQVVGERHLGRPGLSSCGSSPTSPLQEAAREVSSVSAVSTHREGFCRRGSGD